MDKDKFIKYKSKELKKQGFSNIQSEAISNSLYMQQGGAIYNYNKSGNTNLNTADIANVRDMIGIEFTPEFTSAYFSKDINQDNSDSATTKQIKTDYSKLPIQDITSDGQWSNRKVWRTQRPEWFLGKKEPIEGQDYTTIPYKQWESYQSSPEYQQYMAPQVAGSMQQGGISPSPYATTYPTFMNNFQQNPYIGRPEPVTDFTGSPFQTTNFFNSPDRTPEQLGSQYQFSNTDLNLSDAERQQLTNNINTQQPQYNDTTRYNLINPYSGVDLEGALSYAGQGFGSGNNFQGGLGAGLSVLKGARNFLTGYASGKESDRVKRQQFDDLYNPKVNYQYAQQGTEVTNAEILTGEFAVDEGFGNYVIEGGEYLKRAKTGEVQQVVGEPHIKGGKIAEGVNVNLENGDKVLSDYTKIPAKNVKELKERYNISLRKNATFADAQKAYDKKLGIQKETDVLTDLIEKFGKNNETKDETTKRLNDVVLSKEIAASKEKLDLLGNPQSMMFEDLFAIQESLPKKGNGKLLDDNGKPIEEASNAKQEGGTISDLANKFGITEERAQELLALQEGGQPMAEEQVSQEQPSPEQVMQFIAQSLEAGATPEQILQQLVEGGLPQDMAIQMVEQVIGQSQAPQEGVPTQGEVPVAQEGVGFSFATRYAPTIANTDVTGRSIVDSDTLQNVELMQPYLGSGYGAQMQDVEKTINLHSWYFDTEAKKKAFREASKKEGNQPEIREFQTAYNTELMKRAEKAGVPKSEVTDIINKVGFTDKGVQQVDGKYGAFTSTRPLYDFTKAKDGEVKVIETPVATTQTPETVNRNITKNVLPAFPQDLKLAPSVLSPIYREQIALGRIDPTKLSTEPFLASQESQRQADVARVQASGLSPQAQEAVLAGGLASSQLAANDAIMKTELANQANQAQVEQFNLGQRSKEELTNLQFGQQYEQQMLQGMNNYERDLRGYYNEFNAQNRQNYKDVENLNMLNAQNENYQYIPSMGVQYLPSQTTNLALPSLPTNIYDKMTPAEIEAYKKREIEKAKASSMKNYVTTIKNP